MAKYIKRAGIIFFATIVSLLLILGAICTLNIGQNNDNLLDSNNNSSSIADTTTYDFDLNGTCAQNKVIWNNAVQQSKDNNGKNVNVKLSVDWKADSKSDGGTSFGDGIGFDIGRIAVPAGAQITLNLNGHTIDRKLTATYNYGHVLYVNSGILTIKDTSYNKETAIQTFRDNPANLSKLPFGKITGGNCVGGANGAGIRVDFGGTLNFYGGIIVGNTATENGGAIGSVNDGYYNIIKIYDGIFMENKAKSAGGAIAIKATDTLIMTGGILYHNDATVNGGGIAVVGNAHRIDISDVIIDNNFKGAHGGGFAIVGSTSSRLKFSNCEFTNNQITDTGEQYGGGGVYLTSNTVSSFDNCIFNFNWTTEGSFGGGIYARDNCSLSINGGEMSVNMAGYAGGLYMGLNANMKLSNLVINDNIAITGYAGGIAVNSNCASAIMENVIINGNVSKSYAGGVVIHSNSFVKMKNCTVSSNQTDGNAGGIHVSTSSYFEINGCIIEINYSGDMGGGIFCNTDVRCEIENSIIINNTAKRGGGIYAVANSLVRVDSDCEIGNNSADIGGGIYVNTNECILNTSQVYNNKIVNGEETINNDIYLNNHKININSQLVCPENNKIYVQLSQNYSKFTPFTMGYTYYGNGDINPSDIFACTDSGMVATFRNGEVIFESAEQSIYDFIYLEGNERKSYKENDKLHGYNDNEINMTEGVARYVLGNISPNTSVNTFIKNIASLGIDKGNMELYDSTGKKIYENGAPQSGISEEMLDNRFELAVGTGWCIKANGEEMYLSVLGDINGDGRISASDIIYLREIANYPELYNGLKVENKLAGLIINKGSITSADSEILINIMNYNVKIDIFY